MAYKFASSAYLEYGATLQRGGSDLAPPFTLGAWVMPSGTSSQVALSVCDQGNGAANIDGWSLGTGTTFVQQAGTGAAVTGTTISVAPKLTGWDLHIGAFVAANNRNAYLNWGQRTNNTTSRAPSGPFNAHLACDFRNSARGSYFTGKIAEAFCVAGTLHPSQVQALYQGHPITAVAERGTIVFYLTLRGDTYPGLGRDDIPGLGADRWIVSGALGVADHPPILLPKQRKLYLVSPAAGRVLSGACTEGTDSASAAVGLHISASLARAEAADSAAAAAQLVLSAGAALAEASDGLAGQGSVALAASSLFAEHADGAAVVLGVAVSGAIAAAEAQDAFAGEATAPVPPVIDPGFLLRPWPRARRIEPFARRRRTLALPRLRTILATRKKA